MAHFLNDRLLPTLFRIIIVRQTTTFRLPHLLIALPTTPVFPLILILIPPNHMALLSLLIKFTLWK
jgi:hypothetical protein